MSRDTQKGGTNADGSKSAMYCSQCYQNWKFTRPDLTLDGMKDIVRGKMREMGFPGFLAGLFTRNIPKLKRWKGTA